MKLHMKRYISFIMILLITLVSGCQSKALSDPLISKAASHRKGLVYRNGSQILMDGQPFTIKAINFDNLTWFSQNVLDDGTPVYRLHHNEADYDKIKALGFNSVRYMIKWQNLFNDPYTLEENKDGWAWLDRNIRWAKQRRMYIILDFHCPVGGFGTQSSGKWPIWSNNRMQISFVNTWAKIAAKYKDERTVMAYDLMNEPALPGGPSSLSAYRGLMNQAISKIREVDPDKLVIVEAAVGIDGDKDSWTRPNWVKVSDENVMYSFHFYEPLAFTHNGVDTPKKEVKYPSKEFSRTELKNLFREYIKTPRKWGYPLFLGEFGSADWTENSGSEQWTKDMFSLCKEYSIHSAYFNYRSFLDEPGNDFSFSISNIHYSKVDSDRSYETINESLASLIKDELK
ncbi:MAG: glycoside hydrolase family 5 protein [Candidatus Saccharibacteria bacterium]